MTRKERRYPVGRRARRASDGRRAVDDFACRARSFGERPPCPPPARGAASLGGGGVGRVRAARRIRRALPVALATAAVVYASLAGAHAAHAGALNDVQGSIQTIAGQWLNNAIIYAMWLFGISGVTGGMIVAARHYSTVQTWEGLAEPAKNFLLRLIVPLVLIRSAQTVLPHMFVFVGSLASGITGVAMTGPDDLIVLGFKSAGTVFQACTGPIAAYLAANPLVGVTNAVSSSFGATPQFDQAIGLCLLGSLAWLVTLFAFTLIAAELLVRTVDVLIKTSIGAIQLGWAGAPGTSDMAAAYTSSVVSSIFSVIIIYGIASFLSTAAQTAFTMTTLADGSTDLTPLFKSAENALGFSLAAAYLALKVPHLAAEAFAGRPSLAATDAMAHLSRSTTAMTGAVKALRPGAQRA